MEDPSFQKPKNPSIGADTRGSKEWKEQLIVDWVAPAAADICRDTVSEKFRDWWGKDSLKTFLKEKKKKKFRPNEAWKILKLK